MSKFDSSSMSDKTATRIVTRNGETHSFDNQLLAKLGTNVEAIADAVYFYNATKGKDYDWVDENILKEYERQPGAILTDKQEQKRVLHAYQSNIYWEGWITYEDWYFNDSLLTGEEPETELFLIESTGEAKNSYPFDECGIIRETPSMVHGFIVFG